MGIWRFLGLFGQLKNGFFQFRHPHTINIDGRVLFCRDCWEEDGVDRGWDSGEVGVVTAVCKGKQSSGLLSPRLPRLGWEAGGDSFSRISVEKLGF